MRFPDERNMFRGKNLPLFLRTYQEYYALLLGKHGRGKVRTVYNWLFRFLQQMQWGQWMVLEKVCPKAENRGLFYWCFEMIYQSDLLSQYEFRTERTEDGGYIETRIYVVEPDADRQERLKGVFSGRHYRLVDWYNRLLDDPRSNPDVRPEWLMLGEEDNGEEVMENIEND